MAERFLPKHEAWGRYAIWKAHIEPEAVLAVLFRPDDGLFDLAAGSAREMVINPIFFDDVITVLNG
jgi:hypothetical protein